MSERMISRRYEIFTIAPNFYQLGTPDYPAYLSMGDKGMIIEGGTGATFPIIVDQVGELGIEPERIEYLALTHTHPDHIGAVPHLKKLWPHLKVIASDLATTREVLAALMQPLVDLVAEGGEHGHRYLRLIQRLHSDDSIDPNFVIGRWPGGVASWAISISTR